jgi:hypothetical protein
VFSSGENTAADLMRYAPLRRVKQAVPSRVIIVNHKYVDIAHSKHVSEQNTGHSVGVAAWSV